MSTKDNLTDFLTDIADAIRAKKGISGTINPQNFSAEIASIECGRNIVSSPCNVVNFIDCDGTILYSYTKDEFLQLSVLPDLPTRDGLVCQEWNYSYEDALAYVNRYGYLTIGATYITDDNSTRLYMRIATEGRRKVPLFISQTVSGGVSIDWGDESPLETIEGTGYVNTEHEYAQLGEYVIRLIVSEGTLGFGSGSSTYSVTGDTSANGKVYCNMLRKMEIGSNVTSLGGYAFQYCSSLEVCTIPIGVTGLNAYTFGYNYSLKSLVLPRGLTGMGNYTFRDCHSLASASIPSGVKALSTAVFYYCLSLENVSIPETVSSFGVYCFQYCYSLSYFNVPKNVTSFGAFAMAACNGVGAYNFSEYTSVPALGNTNVFNGIQSDCSIIVPAELLESWKSATNWSTYASRIITMEEYIKNANV